MQQAVPEVLLSETQSILCFNCGNADMHRASCDHKALARSWAVTAKKSTWSLSYFFSPVSFDVLRLWLQCNFSKQPSVLHLCTSTKEKFLLLFNFFGQGSSCGRTKWWLWWQVNLFLQVLLSVGTATGDQAHNLRSQHSEKSAPLY